MLCNFDAWASEPSNCYVILCDLTFMTLQHIARSQDISSNSCSLRKAAEAVSCISSSFCFTLCNDEPHKSPSRTLRKVDQYIHVYYTYIYIYRITSAIHSKVCQCCFKFSCDYCQDSLPNKQWSWRKSRMFQLFFGSLRPFWPRLSWCLSWRRCWPLSSKRLAASRSFWQTSHDKLPQIIWKLQE